MQRVLTAALALVLAPVAHGDDPEIVVPHVHEHITSGLANRAPFAPYYLTERIPHYQQAYAAAELAQLEGRPITAIGFRVAPLDGDVLGGAVYRDFEVRLSTGTGLVDNLSTDLFANPGSDETLVWAGDFVLPDLEGDQDPNPFDLRIDLQTPFDYGGGDLLLDIRTSQPNTRVFYLGASAFVLGENVSRAYDLNGTIIMDTLGLMTGFWSGGEVGSVYCSPANLNSTGEPAIIAGYGSDAVAADNLTLVAEQMPSHQFGYFLTSQTQDFVANPAGSQGNLCLGGTIARYAAQVQSTGAGGTFWLAIDLTAIPTTPPTSVLPGETWNFQAWFRDANPTNTSNFTDGLEILFQ